MRVARKRLTILVDKKAIEYFIDMGKEVDMPYHTLINMYLKSCAKKQLRLKKSVLNRAI